MGDIQEPPYHAKIDDLVHQAVRVARDVVARGTPSDALVRILEKYEKILEEEDVRRYVEKLSRYEAYRKRFMT